MTMKIEAINQNMSFMQYIVNLIQKDLEAKKSKQEKELMRQNIFLSLKAILKIEQMI